MLTRSRLLCAIAGGLVLMLSMSSAHADSPVTEHLVIVGDDTPGPYWITGYFVLTQSDTLTQNDRPLIRDKDYTFDYNNGTIEFVNDLELNDSVLVRYQRLPWRLSSRLTLHNTSTEDKSSPYYAALTPATLTQPTAGGSRLPSVPGNGAAVDGMPSRLSWAGYKSFSFSNGSVDGRRFSQGLELSVDGEISEGLNLRAGISDRAAGARSSSGTSAGATRLDQLDQMFIEAKSDRFRARWGDMSLSDRTTGSTTRNASGAEFHWQDSSQSVGGYMARARGRPAIARVPLRPGDAGPYTVAQQPLTQGIVHGSLRVLLDGKRLQEGVHDDFTVDESRGTITFSPSITITSQSVCVVEYEQALDTYGRSLAGAEWEWNGDGRSFRNRTALAWESEGTTPLNGSLTSSERRILADDPDGSTQISAAEFAGSKQGDYKLDTRNGDSIYIYVGPANGEWRVRFEWVGNHQGRYRHLIDEAYEYVGPGQGSYEPTTTLTAPVSRLRVEESATIPLGPAGTVETDLRGWLVDPNRFASHTTSATSDHRLAWRIGNWARDAGRSGIVWQWYRRGQATEETSDTYSRRLIETWELSHANTESRYSDHELTAQWPVGDFLRVNVSGGRLTGNAFTGWRGQAVTQLNWNHRLGSEWSWKERGVRGPQSPIHDRTRSVSSTVFADPGPARLEYGWGQDNTSNEARLFESMPRYTSTQWLSVSRFGVTAQHRWETSLDSLSLTTRHTREASLSVPLQIVGAQSGADLTLTRGVEATNDNRALPFYRGKLNGRWTITQTAMVQADMDLRHGQAGSQREIYLPTRLGAGEYRYERGEYVPDPHGDYRRVLIDDDVSSAGRAYDGHRLLALNWHPHIGHWRFTIDSRRELRGRYRSSMFRPGQWIMPWSVLTGALLPGAQSTTTDQHSLSAAPNRKTEIKIRLLRDDRQTASNDPGIEYGEGHTRTVAELSARRDLLHSIFILGRLELESQYRSGSILSAIQSKARTLAMSAGVAPRASAAASLEGRYRVDDEQVAGYKTELWGARPETRIRWRGLTFHATTDLTWVTTTESQFVVSSLLSEGRPVGFAITEGLELHWDLPGQVTLRANASGDQRQSGADRWRMQIETIARF